MQKFEEPVQNLRGDTIALAPMLVLLAGTETPATIWYDAAGQNAILDPRTDRSGVFAFYAANGRYDVYVLVNGVRLGHKMDLLMYDPTSGSGSLAALSESVQVLADAADTTSEALEAVRTELDGTVSVKRFGAIGDGVTDDTAAIQAAIDYAKLDGSPKVVTVPNGRYKVNQIHIRFGVSLIGADVARRGMPGNWINAGASSVTYTGTDFITDAGQNSTAHTDAFIFMHPQSKVANINVWYAGQTRVDDPATIVTYAPTIAITSSEDGNSDNCVVQNISALNCYEFMRIGDNINSVGRPIVSDCWANPFGPVGIKCRTMNGDVGMFNRVFIENLFTINSVDRPNLYAARRLTLVAFDLGYSQGVNLTDCIALSCKYGLSVTSQTWAQVNNCLFDYCLTPVYANGADRVFLNNCSLAKNIGAGHCMEVLGTVNHLALTNCVLGDPYSTQKTGIFCKHTSGTVKVVATTFTMKYPAVLNTGAGAVQVSACGIGYESVTGENIAIDGGPPLVAGASLAITGVNPTSPAATGWTYTTPANVTAITNGIRVQGAGNNTLNFRPATISAAENNKIFYGTQIYCLSFNLKVTGQSGSPKMEILVLTDGLAVSADAFQVSQDAATSDSGLPEGEVYKVSIILPWAGDASQIRFNLPNQVATTAYEITGMDIKQVVLPRGFTGLEWFAGKTKLPLGHYDAQTGGKVWWFPSVPTAGTWSTGDRTINLTPTVGQPKAWTYTAAGAWASEGNLS